MLLNIPIYTENGNSR